MSSIIKHVLAPNGQTRVTFYCRSDGWFEFSHDRFYVDDHPEDDFYMEYWAPGRPSGIYASAETAMREASIEFPWVFEDINESGI